MTPDQREVVERIIGMVAHDQTWQPIETAPKDGVIVWGWTPYQPQIVRAFVWGVPQGRARFEGWVTAEKRCMPTYAPTHWMPLPAAPNGDTR